MRRKRMPLFCMILVFTGAFAAGAATVQGGESTAGPAESTPAPNEKDPLDHLDLLSRLLSSQSSQEEASNILDRVAQSGDTRFVAGLIDLLRYHRPLNREIGRTLTRLTGQKRLADWGDWVEWAGRHPEISSFTGYPAWKARIYEKLDPEFRRFVHANMNIAPDSRVEEIVWGGVSVDGIPALDNPKMVAPVKAGYLIPDERVFGVSINGEARAYPARFLDWHEMFNDVIGGEPVTLAY